MGFNDESTINIEFDKSELNFDAGYPGEMSLSILGKKMLVTQPVSFGPIDESVGYLKKFRKHDYVYCNGYGVDTECLIPMGAEPKISRTMEMAGNHVKVVTDILTRGGFPAEKMSVDDILFHGEYKRFGVIKFPEGNSELQEIEWTEINDDSTVLYESEVPFLLMLLESEDGHVVEIGTGDDLWRWRVADGMEETTSCFKVEKSFGEIRLTRDVMSFAEEVAMKTQMWRFKWYIAWEMKVDRNDVIKVPADVVELDIKGAKIEAADPEMPAFLIPGGEWGETAVTEIDGKVTEFPCLHAKTSFNFYRKWFRPTQKKYQGTTISLSNMEPHFCESSSHLGRKEFGTLSHWDMLNIFDFWMWANKQAAKNEGSFVIIPPKGSVAGQLPSMRGLSRKM